MSDLLRVLKKIKEELDEILIEQKAAFSEKDRMEEALIELGIEGVTLKKIDEEIVSVNERIRAAQKRIRAGIESIEKLLEGNGHDA